MLRISPDSEQAYLAVSITVYTYFLKSDRVGFYILYLSRGCCARRERGLTLSLDSGILCTRNSVVVLTTSHLAHPASQRWTSVVETTDPFRIRMLGDSNVGKTGRSMGKMIIYLLFARSRYIICNILNAFCSSLAGRYFTKRYLGDRVPLKLRVPL